MPFGRPTLTALRNQAVEDITTSGVPGLDGLLRNAVLRVLAWVMAGLAYSEYGYLDWIARQSVPFTATDEFLEAWAALIGVFRKDATGASGFATFNGNAAGLVIPIGRTMTRQDGTPYVAIDVGTTDVNGNVTVPIGAMVMGAATNCDDGTPIAIDDPIAGINASGETTGPVTGGADQETDEALRTRMLAKYRAPPQGGAIADYEQWALEVPGVTRAWCTPNGHGVGTVDIRFMLDDVQAAHDGFPQGTDGCATNETRGPTATGDQLNVANHIWPVQPVTALVYAIAPVPNPIDVELTALDPDTPDIEAQITASLNDMFLVRAEPGGTLYPSDFYEAVLATPGVNHFILSEPSGPVTSLPGALPVMGTLTIVNVT